MIEQLTAGIDPGSSSVKVAIMRSRGGQEGVLLGRAVQRIRRRSVDEVVKSAFEEALAQASLRPEQLSYIASTGNGESVAFRTGHFYGITTHARGALFLCPSARGALDVGALHARAIKVGPEGRVLGHRMTSQCASGSGQFLENIARYLGVPLEDVGALSKTASAPEKDSAICAVLAETDVINTVARGVPTPDILKGIHLSIAGRLVQLVRAGGIEGPVLVTGGLSKDIGLLAAIVESAAEGKKKAVAATFETHPDAVLAGALGAALLGAFRDTHRRQNPNRLKPLQTETTTAT